MVQKEDGKYMGSVKVGTKGQIVIPKEVREMFHITPGDSLVIMADPKQGVIMHRLDFFTQVADEIFSGKRQSETKEEAEGLQSFAQGIKTVEGESE